MLGLSTNNIASATNSAHINNRDEWSLHCDGVVDNAYAINTETTNAKLWDDKDFCLSFWLKLMFATDVGTASTTALATIFKLGSTATDNLNVAFYGSTWLGGTPAIYITLSEGGTPKTISYGNTDFEDPDEKWGKWVHFAINADRDGFMTLYYNASSVATINITATQGDMFIGGSGTGWEIGNVNNGYSGFQGNIKDFAFWNDTLLTADDITAIYNSGVPTDLTASGSYDSDKSDKLTAYWRFNDLPPTQNVPLSVNNQTTTADLSGVSYTGGNALTLNGRGFNANEDAQPHPSTPTNP